MDNATQSTGHARHLDSWEELVGELVRLEDDHGQLTVHLSAGTFSFDASSREAAIIRERLTRAEGRVVSILRVDSEHNPIRIDVKDDES